MLASWALNEGRSLRGRQRATAAACNTPRGRSAGRSTKAGACGAGNARGEHRLRLCRILLALNEGRSLRGRQRLPDRTTFRQAIDCRRSTKAGACGAGNASSSPRSSAEYRPRSTKAGG